MKIDFRINIIKIKNGGVGRTARLYRTTEYRKTHDNSWLSQAMCGSCMTCTLESSCFFSSFLPWPVPRLMLSWCPPCFFLVHWWTEDCKPPYQSPPGLTHTKGILFMGLLPPRHDLGSMKSLTGWTTSCLQNRLPSSFCYKRWSFEQQWGMKYT